MKYTYDNPPLPLKEGMLKDKIDRELWDSHVPKGGFIEDFVLGTRGIETPTRFAVWAGLHTISALLKRDAWYKWYPKNLYPNIFLIFIAPPRICAKSTCVDIGEAILVESSNHYDDPFLTKGKTIRLHHSKVTPEMLFDIMGADDSEVKVIEKVKDEEYESLGEEEAAKTEAFLSATAKKAVSPKAEDVVTYNMEKISDLALNISELTTFLGKQKYTEHLVDLLTYMYDCPARADEATRTYGAQTLENVYLTFFGATTPDSFNKSLPETAFGGGFLSRTILVASYLPTRYYPIPRLLSGAPSTEELAKRLAWIGEYAQGEYEFTSEAYDEYIKWYRPFKDSLVGDPLGDARARTDTNLLKLCVLLRAQRYEPGNYITRQDFLDAKFLLEDAFDSAKDLYAGANGSEYYTMLVMVQKYIMKYGQVPRHQLLKEFTVKKITPELLTQIITHLHQTEQITISYKGQMLEEASARSSEIYKHIEKEGENGEEA